MASMPMPQANKNRPVRNTRFSSPGTCLFMIGPPVLTNGATTTTSTPATASSSATHPMAIQLGGEAALHLTPAKAKNHNNTDKSTCTTNALRKKSTEGNKSD